MFRNFLILLVSLLSFAACNDPDCIKDNACSEKPPSDELCDMAAERWFYDEETSKCELIGYSGCDFYGFETREECEQCDCSD